MKSRVELAILQWKVKDLVLKVREAFDGLGSALQTVVESSERSSNVVANKVKVELGQTLKWMSPSLDMTYDGTFGATPCERIPRW